MSMINLILVVADGPVIESAGNGVVWCLLIESTVSEKTMGRSIVIIIFYTFFFTFPRRIFFFFPLVPSMNGMNEIVAKLSF